MWSAVLLVEGAGGWEGKVDAAEKRKAYARHLDV